MNPTYEDLQQKIKELEKENHLLRSIIDQSPEAADEELKHKRDNSYRTLIAAQARQEHLLTIQHQIDSLSNLSTSLNSSLKKAFKYLLAIDWIDLGGIYLFDEERKRLKLVFSEGLSEDYLKAVSVYSTNDPETKLILKGKSRYANTRVFLKPVSDFFLKEKLTFLVAIPLIYKKEVIGSLNLGSKSVDDIDSHDRLILESIASRLANLIILVKTREQLLSANLNLNRSIRSRESQQHLLIQKSRLESLGELTAGLAHEVNQPLSVISLVMENINYKLEQNTASEQYLTRKFSTISQNIDKIRKLIDHFRIFSRDQGSIMFEKVDVNQVIADSLSMIESQLNNHQILVVKKFCLNLGFSLGNPARLEQVMLNLLSNARDALDEKDKKLKLQDNKKIILVKTYTEKKRIIIKIRDTGMGIPKENLDRIYDPFFTTKGEGQGTGLGLAIVYGIVTDMKGEIRVNSEEMAYTEFTISLPGYNTLSKKP